MPRVLVALLAGLPAIALNKGALAAADLVPLGTAHGGLLHLLVMLTGSAVRETVSNLGGLPGVDRGCRPGGAQGRRVVQARDDLPPLFSPQVCDGLMRTKRPVG
jgi:hypothetical protein